MPIFGKLDMGRHGERVGVGHNVNQRRAGMVYGLGAVCSYYGAPLNNGKIVEGTIECPWQGSRFALKDGMIVQGPAWVGVPVYDCKIANDRVQIKLRR